MKRRRVRPVVVTCFIVGAVAGGTAADDLAEPAAALSLTAVTAIAVTAVQRLFTRLDRTERELAEERARLTALEGEYQVLVEDYNELVLDHAQQSSYHPASAAGPEDHGPRCQCRRRGPRPFLTLVDYPGHQESG